MYRGGQSGWKVDGRSQGFSMFQTDRRGKRDHFINHVFIIVTMTTKSDTPVRIPVGQIRGRDKQHVCGLGWRTCWLELDEGEKVKNLKRGCDHELKHVGAVMKLFFTLCRWSFHLFRT